MKYGEGWAYDTSRSHYKRAKPTGTDPEDDRQIDSALPAGSTSKTYDPQRDHTIGDMLPHLKINGSQDYAMKDIYPVRQETLLRQVQLPMVLRAFVKVMEMP